MLIVIHHSITQMSNLLRFTPLYVIRMLLDIKYGENSHIIIPEALLEHTPKFEEDLRQDLKKIDMIAESGDTKLIIEYVKSYYSIMKDNNIYIRYASLYRSLFYDKKYEVCENLEKLMQHVKIPNIINRDFVKDLIPINQYVFNGKCNTIIVFDCIFRYILYTKTKHLNLFNEYIKSRFFSPYIGIGNGKNDNYFIFNY